MPTIVGLFDSETQANAAIGRLEALGLRQGVVGVAVRKAPSEPQGRAAAAPHAGPQDGAAESAPAHAAPGHLRIVLFTKSFVVEGTGKFLIGGPIATALMAADIEYDQFDRGLVLVSVQAHPEQAFCARMILYEEGARRTHLT